MIYSLAEEARFRLSVATVYLYEAITDRQKAEAREDDLRQQVDAWRGVIKAEERRAEREGVKP